MPRSVPSSDTRTLAFGYERMRSIEADISHIYERNQQVNGRKRLLANDELAERVGLQAPSEISNLPWQPLDTRTIDFTKLFSRVANPIRPVVAATLSPSGRTVSYACEWCGGRHRHHADSHLFTKGVTSKQQHCQVWRRLHPNVWPDSVRLVLVCDL
jgi:hypothetical protein